jgi:hypothetical protein
MKWVEPDALNIKVTIELTYVHYSFVYWRKVFQIFKVKLWGQFCQQQIDMIGQVTRSTKNENNYVN